MTDISAPLRTRGFAGCAPNDILGSQSYVPITRTIGAWRRVRVHPKAKAVLPAVDVAIGVRYREVDPCRNYPHWRRVAEALRSHGLTVGLVGLTGIPGFEADANAWQHPDGPTAGSVDILNHCRLYLGTDSGTSHLAAICNAPMLVMYSGCSAAWDQTGVMALANQTWCERLPDAAWNCPEAIIGRTMAVFGIDPYFSQHGEDKWILENLPVPERGVFVDVGAADGRHLSNSLAFEQRGWSGIAIEADPRRDLGWRECVVEKVAVADFDGEIQFAQTPNPDLSGILRDGTAIKLPCNRLQTILDRNGTGEIDVLSIDTEGTELDVWRSFDVQRHRPKIVIIEWDTVGMPDRSEEILGVFRESGYALCTRRRGISSSQGCDYLPSPLFPRRQLIAGGFVV